MQSSFVDIGLERDAFLYITDFMEEAGDSADFEAEGGQRGPRRDGRERGTREPVTLEGNNQPAEESSRPSERSDRGRGGRGRGRRDRGGNRERQPGTEYAAPETAEPSYPSEEAFTPEEPVEELQADRPESVGEGAPGADGSRRWRGRRGRRRGRGPRDDARQQAAAPASQAETLAPADPYESSLEIDGAAEHTHTHEASSNLASGVNEYPQENTPSRTQRPWWPRGSWPWWTRPRAWRTPGSTRLCPTHCVLRHRERLR